MRNDETGEFELVLGNKQVLSAFFVIVVLFGVFFGMGYVVGRSSAPAPRVDSGAAVPAPAPDSKRRSEAAPTGEALPPETVKPVETAQAKPDEAPSQPSTQPAQEPASAPQAPPEPRRAAQAAAEPEPALRPASGGTYLQVTAVKRSEADVVADALKKKGFPVVIGPAPRSDLYRVLVGPFQDSGSLAKSKLELENAGFHPFVQR